MKKTILACIGLLWLIGCQPEKGEKPLPEVAQWHETELVFTSGKVYENPYTALEMYAVFTHESGESLKRPAFWDGGNTWKIRFAPTTGQGIWSWETHCSDESNTGLHGQKGQLASVPQTTDHALLKHGFLRMSPGKRNVVHADGTPFLLVGDTPWALPFRATYESCLVYARKRQAQGFNAALLMTVQPDQKAEGPRNRTEVGAFDVGFEDLPKGGMNQLNVAYFQYFDSLSRILVDHGIVPVYQPVFQGFGWKGLEVLGRDANPDEYARYMRYLVARYGARPAFWLVNADNNGLDPPTAPAGEMVESWDAYQQPTGIHYNPFDDYVPDFMKPGQCMHLNKSYQDADWLDFQWCQTGHDGKHLFHKVERMYENLPTKAVANGEPTYERINKPDRGAGWWQGHEAWMQLCSGGTMGVVYGAGGLWQWKLFADEPGWADWCNSEANWQDALEYEGANYVGLLNKAFEGQPFPDMIKYAHKAGGKPALAVPGKFYVVYLENGGAVNLETEGEITFYWFDPKSGAKQPAEGNDGKFSAPGAAPWVLIGSRQPAA
jgi:hypothetical protein